MQAEALTLIGVATSVATVSLGSSLGIPLRELEQVEALDICLDGADEIDPEFRMIKEWGGALLWEKIVACASNRRVRMITADKRVERLGQNVPVPVEVSSIGVKHTRRRLERVGASTAIWRRENEAADTTDGGNEIIDCRFAQIVESESPDRQLQWIAGVLETGLFIDLCDTLIIGTSRGAELIESRVRQRREQ
jgi:ribose 5-phosphate isomerase A